MDSQLSSLNLYPTMQIKHCARCKQSFECNPMMIEDCQCSRIQLNETERAFIAKQFEDCLCLDCLTELKRQYTSL